MLQLSEPLERRLLLATIVVNTTDDTPAVDPTVSGLDINGSISLRSAIERVNALDGADAIHFAIGSGAQTIAPRSALPELADAVTIDATTQPGFDPATHRPMIQLDGSAAAGASGLVITGGSSSVRGLVINRFEEAGVLIASSDNRICGNYIGTDLAGMSALGNGTGVSIRSGTNNTVGGSWMSSLPPEQRSADRNVISGNAGNGVHITSSDNRVEGNYIGLASTGWHWVGNNIGVYIESTASRNIVGRAGWVTESTFLGAGNSIGANRLDGVFVAGSDNTVQSNGIGTNIVGEPAPNQVGVYIHSTARNNLIGGPGEYDGNNISGNQGDGIYLAGDQNVVQRNYIGVQMSRNRPPLLVAGPANAVGVRIDSQGTGNLIGGPSVGNAIASNSSAGIIISGANNTVQGNDIGRPTHVDGSGHTYNGIGVVIHSGLDNTIGGTGAGEGNTVRDNIAEGVLISGASTGNRLQANTISGNSDGVVLRSSGNVVGGSDAEGNTITGNRANGVVVADDSTNALRCNRISANGRLGIDLGNDGVTPNDPLDEDAGSNGLQNYPVLLSATSSHGRMAIQGTLNNTPLRTYLVDFFGNDELDPSQYGEGERYLGTTEVSTDGAGHATFNATLPAAPASRFVTATATIVGDSPGAIATSEFSKGIEVRWLPTELRIDDVTIAETHSGAAAATFTITRSGDVGFASSVEYLTADGTAKAGSDYAGVPRTPLEFAANETTKRFSVSILGDTLIEPDETYFVLLSNATNAVIVDDRGVGTIVNDDPEPTGVDVHLSDLTPTVVANGWGPYERDRSNGEKGETDGHVITLNGVTYAKGLGVHANSVLTYNLAGGNYTEFGAAVGLDDEVSNRGSVIFQVWLDGVLATQTPVLRGSSATQLLDINVIGKSTLELRVLATVDGNYADHADWADAKLYKLGAPDTTAPTPHPSTWATAPIALGADSIRMVATTATDVSGVQYFFDETSGNPGGNDSGWQDSPVYVDTGLSKLTTYRYTVRTRDKSLGQNEGAASAPAPATTLDQPPILFLSDIDPLSDTNGWGSYERDRSNGEQGSADGHTLTLNGTTYTKGLGVHAEAILTYSLIGRNVSRFLSDVGIDDEAFNFGSVYFEVWLDGVKVRSSTRMTGASATQSFDIDVTGKSTLQLRVTGAGDGNARDHADWAGARLIA